MTQGLWVVTGGLGALGLLTAQWLADRGRRHVCLLGRIGRYCPVTPRTSPNMHCPTL